MTNQNWTPRSRSYRSVLLIAMALYLLPSWTLLSHMSRRPEQFQRYSTEYFAFLLAYGGGVVLGLVALRATPKQLNLMARAMGYIRGRPWRLALALIGIGIATLAVLVGGSQWEPGRSSEFLLSTLGLAIGAYGVIMLPYLKHKQLALGVAVSLGSLVLSMLMLEMLFRVFGGNSLPGHDQLLIEHDSLLGWRKIPSAARRLDTAEYSIQESINSKGIRGPEYAYEKGNNEYRVLVLGDSFAEGYTVEFKDLFSEILKTKLNDESIDKYFQIINFGTSGYSTDQELLLFQSEGTKYGPDLTILMFHDNDVWYNNQPKLGREHKPLLQHNEDGKLKLTNYPVPQPDRLASNFLRDPSETTDTWLYRASYVYRFLVDRSGIIPRLHKLAAGVGLASDFPPIPAEFKIYEQPVNADVADAWRITEALIVKLKDEVDAAGSDLLVFYVPGRSSIYIEEENELRRLYGLAKENWSMDQVEHELEVICDRNNIEFIGPVQSFRVEANRSATGEERLYFPIDAHWNRNGHRFAGEILAAYVETSLLGEE